MFASFADLITFNFLNLMPDSALGKSVHFFAEDAVKIFILLILITHAMSALRAWIPMEKINTLLRKRRFYGLDYLLSAFLGSVTPFCSCSSIPLFIGFLQAGLPLGPVFTFLITSPLINEVALVLMLGMFGWQITLAYLAAGIGIGIAGGILLNDPKIERWIAPDLGRKVCRCAKDAVEDTTHQQQSHSLGAMSHEAFAIVRKVAPFLLVGIALGAVIHGYVPAGAFEEVLKKHSLLSVPLAVMLAIPLYANASGILPILQALVDKGVPIGTALAFMMATVGLSLPEALILKRVMHIKLLLLFFGIVAVGIVAIGYAGNALL